MIFWEPIIWSTFFFFSNQIQIFTFLIFGCLIGLLLFILGIMGLIIRQISLIYILLSIELIFFGMIVNFLFLGFLLFLPFLQVVVFLLLVVSASETAIFLAIIFLYHKQTKSTDTKYLSILKK